MTIAPEDKPGSETTNLEQGATPVQPITDTDLATATPLLLSITTEHPDEPELVLAEAGDAGAHVVRRRLTADALRHFYKIVYAAPGTLTFRTLFSQPSSVAAEALRVVVVTKNDDGTIVTNDNTGSSVAHGGAGGAEGSSVAHGDAGGAEGSSVAHGDFGQMDIPVIDGEPTYYLMVALIDGNTLVDKPYTLVVLQV
jgi:hypothetical protein